ncbi:hypothetical protein VNO77_25542 [Canavalia gladiata]|uniref:Uncharacterized protein n=1 Tax=Canavalia gladiata TaxID=3824 RepID=A0AAN9L8C2_CANGL
MKANTAPKSCITVVDFTIFRLTNCYYPLTRDHVPFIPHRANQRLRNWKSQKPSFACCLTLSLRLFLRTACKQCYCQVPTSTCDELDKLNRRNELDFGETKGRMKPRSKIWPNFRTFLYWFDNICRITERDFMFQPLNQRATPTSYVTLGAEREEKKGKARWYVVWCWCNLQTSGESQSPTVPPYVTHATTTTNAIFFFSSSSLSLSLSLTLS